MKKIFTLLLAVMGFSMMASAQGGDYMMVGTWQGWSWENDPLVFTYVETQASGDEVYTGSVSKIYGDWKIVKDHSWDGALGGGGMNMQVGQEYDLTPGGANTGFAAGYVVKNATFTLTVHTNGSATIKVEGTAGEEHSYGVVGAFQGWNAGGAPLLVEQSDGSYGLAISNFPGGQDFKISIDKTWTCFLAQDGRTTLEFAVPYTCARANNDNNFNVGVSGTNYNVWISLVVAANAQSAEITVTETTTGITLLSTAVEKADEVFNVAGQRLSQPAKGLNIINGKKVLVK